MSNDLKEWIRKVKIAMVDAGDMSQAQLARLIGVSPPVISDLFKYGKASQQVIKKINACLDIK